MARNDIGRRKFFKFFFPSLEPINCDCVLENRQHALMKRDVTCDHQALLWQPNHDVTRAVRGTNMQSLNVHSAKGDSVALFKGFIGQNNPAAFRALLQAVLRSTETLRAAIFKLMGRVDMGDDLDPLIRPIRIAQHGMTLAVLINHEAHRLIGEGFDLFMERLCQKIRAAAVDDHDPIAGHDEA